jgi:hypothetical protein
MTNVRLVFWGSNMINNGEYGAWKIWHLFQYTTEAHNEKYTANLCKMSNQNRKEPGIAAAGVGAKCKEIPHRPGHDVPKKADDEPALPPPLTTKVDIEVNFVGDPWQLGQQVDHNCRCYHSHLVVVCHRWHSIEEGGDDNNPCGCRGNGL